MAEATAGEEVTGTGRLVRHGGGFALRLDGGGVLALDLHRVPVDHVEKQVRVSGRRVAADRIEVLAIRAA